MYFTYRNAKRRKGTIGLKNILSEIYYFNKQNTLLSE